MRVRLAEVPCAAEEGQFAGVLGSFLGQVGDRVEQAVSQAATTEVPAAILPCTNLTGAQHTACAWRCSAVMTADLYAIQARGVYGEDVADSPA